jgi:hypothetical protein
MTRDVTARTLTAGIMAGIGIAGVALLAGCTQADAPVWRVYEITLSAERSHPRPSQVDVWAAITGPDGERLRVPGFWDGGDTWRVRFAPTSKGRWSWITQAGDADGTPLDDPGLQGITGEMRAGPATGDNPLYQHGGFLRVSDNRRYLTYSDGTPFFWLGDTWWFCPSSLVPREGSSNPAYDSMLHTLVERRSAQGYTVVHWAFQGEPVVPGAWLMTQARGQRLEPAYWQEVDAYVTYATEAGLVPAIALTWWYDLEQLPLESLQFLWRNVIARYGAYPVTWLITGEYNVIESNADISDRVAKVAALGQYIKDTDPYHRAMTVHPWWYQGDRRQIWDEPWYDFIMFQGAHGAYPKVDLYLGAYARDDRKPILESECNYEGIHQMTDADVRWAAYRAIQAGSFGYTYGAHGLWYPTQGPNDRTFDEWGEPIPWWEALEQPGGAQMGYLRDLYTSLPWWELEPRPDALRVEGLCTYMMRPMAKAAGDDLYVIYLSRGLQAEASVSLLDADTQHPYAAEWFDPRTGKVTSLAKRLRAAEEGLTLPPRPDAQDWILVLHKRD